MAVMQPSETVALPRAVVPLFPCGALKVTVGAPTYKPPLGGFPTQWVPGLVTVTSVTCPAVTVAVALAPPDTADKTFWSPVRPTAPLYVNAPGVPAEYAPTSLAPSVVAGSPGCSVP